MATRTLNVLALALIAPLAFAQVNTTNAEQMTASDVVTTFELGKMIVVGSETEPNTTSYVLDKSILYVNSVGEKLDEKSIKPGTRVRIYFEAKGQSRVIQRVVVEGDGGVSQVGAGAAR